MHSCPMISRKTKICRMPRWYKKRLTGKSRNFLMISLFVNKWEINFRIQKTKRISGRASASTMSSVMISLQAEFHWRGFSSFPGHPLSWLPKSNKYIDQSQIGITKCHFVATLRKPSSSLKPKTVYSKSLLILIMYRSWLPSLSSKAKSSQFIFSIATQ